MSKTAAHAAPDGGADRTLSPLLESPSAAEFAAAAGIPMRDLVRRCLSATRGTDALLAACDAAVRGGAIRVRKVLGDAGLVLALCVCAAPELEEFACVAAPWE